MLFSICSSLLSQPSGLLLLLGFNSSINQMTTVAVKKRKPVFVKVEDLKPGTSGHNLTVKVVSSKVVPAHKTRHASSSLSKRPKPPSHIAKCLVGDNIASSFSLPATTKVDIIKLGATVIAGNAKIDMFKGSMQLAVDKWGSIEAADLQTSVLKKTPISFWLSKNWLLFMLD